VALTLAGFTSAAPSFSSLRWASSCFKTGIRFVHFDSRYHLALPLTRSPAIGSNGTTRGSKSPILLGRGEQRSLPNSAP